MGFASPTPNVRTVAKAPLFGWFRFTVGATGAVGTIRQGKSNHVKSVTRTGVGAYTVEFNRPFPLNLLDIDFDVNRLLVGNGIRNVSMDFTYGLVQGNDTTGTTFKFFVSGDTAANNTVQVATELIQGTELVCSYVWQDLNLLKD
jgi:hypothetical protein